MATSNSPTDAPYVIDDAYELTTRLSTGEDGTTTCTIYPENVEAEKQVTTWISAEDDAFVNVADYR
ncbi:DUF7511 domain-containing protein [Halorarius litoreus]|uniref:DUF7511 domain-containing protein n=1 Tax=Halorarius litoreus TaxID=2962676 RepID=UPI0020CED520|nr:hypothetical protein [Halorarius litoreus]